MLKIFGIEKGGPVREESLADLSDLIQREDTFVWVDLQSGDQGDFSEFAQLFSLDPDSVNDCFEGEQRPRIDDYDSYHLLFMYGMLGPGDRYEFNPHKLVVFVGHNFMISVHEEPIRAIQMLRTKALRRPRLFPNKGVYELLYGLIDQVVDNYLVFMQTCEDEVDRLEDQSLEPDCEPEIIQASSSLKSTLSEIRHLVHAMDQMIANTLIELADVLDEDIVFEFRHVRDHLTTVAELSDRLRDRLNAVRDNYSFILVNRTNEIMKVLTIFASIMLPLSLIAGIFGMNFKLIPAQDSQYGFAAVLLGMMGIGLALWVFFRRRNWL